MLFLRSLYCFWQHQTRVEQIGWIGILLFLGYLLWHVLFVTDFIPGPYHLVAQLHPVFFFVFWCLLLVIVPVSFVFPVTTLRRIKRRWLKIIGLGLLGLGITAALIPVLAMNAGIHGLLLLLMLSIFFDIWWILIVVRRFPERIRTRSEIAFSVLLVLILLLIPIGGFGFESVDSLTVKEWGKSYHVGYMSFDDIGKLALYECGSVNLFCQEIYHYCNNLGPSPDSISLSWARGAEDRLSLKLGSSSLYVRSRDNVVFKESSVYSRCNYSLWG